MIPRQPRREARLELGAEVGVPWPWGALEDLLGAGVGESVGLTGREGRSTVDGCLCTLPSLTKELTSYL